MLAFQTSQPIREQIIAKAIYDRVTSLTYAPLIVFDWSSNAKTNVKTCLKQLLKFSVSTEDGSWMHSNY